MLIATLTIGLFFGIVLASIMGLFRRPAGAPGQIVTVNPAPAAARPPGCLAQLAALLRLAVIIFLLLFFLRLLMLS